MLVNAAGGNVTINYIIFSCKSFVVEFRSGAGYLTFRKTPQNFANPAKTAAGF
jgi:hypothetical protein